MKPSCWVEWRLSWSCDNFWNPQLCTQYLICPRYGEQIWWRHAAIDQEGEVVIFLTRVSIFNSVLIIFMSVYMILFLHITLLSDFIISGIAISIVGGISHIAHYTILHHFCSFLLSHVIKHQKWCIFMILKLHSTYDVRCAPEKFFS